MKQNMNVTKNYAEFCLLCGRFLTEPYDKHHIIPKSRGGNVTVLLHRICHSKIHSVLSEKELETNFNSIEKLKDHLEIKKFIKWISGKPPGFYKKTSKKK